MNNNTTPTRSNIGSFSRANKRTKNGGPRYYYFSRRGDYYSGSSSSSSRLNKNGKNNHNNTIPPSIQEVDFVGYYSRWALLNGCVFLMIPCSYVYIVLVVLREGCVTFPVLRTFLETYLSPVAVLAAAMHKSSRIVEVWCFVEAIFYVLLKLQIHYLQRKDVLECQLSAAPMMDLSSRNVLWRRMMDTETGSDPVAFLTGWFFHARSVHDISSYDVCDFVAWSMFEGRHQEHLTEEECIQLEDMVQEIQLRISLQLYGAVTVEAETTTEPPPVPALEAATSVEDDRDNRRGDDRGASTTEENDLQVPSNEKNETTTRRGEEVNEKNLPSFKPRYGNDATSWRSQLPQPQQLFEFHDEIHYKEPNFFVTLYETYRRRYDTMVKRDDFHPVQDVRAFVSAVATDFDVAVQRMLKQARLVPPTLMAGGREQGQGGGNDKSSSWYESLVPPGSPSVVGKQISAVSHKTYQQWTEAWNAVLSNVKESYRVARTLSKRRLELGRQLRGYRVMYSRMRSMTAGSVPAQQMAATMRRITETTRAMEGLESAAQRAFCCAAGLARKSTSAISIPLLQDHERSAPQLFAKYSSDRLQGLATYPLFFHALILAGTDVPLRIILHRKGFERRRVGPVSYYYHPGTLGSSEDDDDDETETDDDTEDDDAAYVNASYNGREENDEDDDASKTPLVFVHGIGIGLISYLYYIDCMVATGRPIFLPEIPYVCGFRPWQSPQAVLQPAAVCSTMTAMLACHGFLRGCWMGHSYGTSWLSYVCKYTPGAVAALLFLDPICFCLQMPRLTKSFVYSKPDPGTISYMVRTDVIVNWTIQRSFPWAWIILFCEEIKVPCSIFLSEHDALVPARKVEAYLRSKNVPVKSFEDCTESFFRDNRTTCAVFPKAGHGTWTEDQYRTVPTIATAMKALCQRAEDKTSSSSS